MKVFLPQETLSLIKDKNIILDTCLFFDIATLHKNYRSIFLEKLEMLRGANCDFITIEPVEVEFMVGSDKGDFEIKQIWFNSLVSGVLPTRQISNEIINDLILEYGKEARGNLSYTDICLGAAAKQYKKNSLLLTRNYKDFPSRIFDCVSVFALSLQKEIRTYGFYEYKGIGNKKIESKVTLG